MVRPSIPDNSPTEEYHSPTEGHRTCRYILTTDQSDAGSAGIFSRRTNQTQEARVYSPDGPIRLTLTCSPACRSARRRTSAVYSHDGPIRRRKRRYILTTDQSDAESAGIFSRQTNQTCLPGGPARGKLQSMCATVAPCPTQRARSLYPASTSYT
eukprot:1186071-Prorocentrum_minimum.AAC.1